MLSGKALYVMSKACLLRVEEEALKSSLLQLSNLYLLSRADGRFLFISLSSSLSISMLSCKQLGPAVLSCAANAFSLPVLSEPLLDASVRTAPPCPQLSGTVSLDKDDHFRRGRESFMSSEESCSPLL